MTSETRQVLELVSTMRKQGLISQAPPVPQPDTPSLADYAQDREAYLACIQPARLRVITMGTTQGIQQTDCRVDAMICQCHVHQAERAASIRRQKAARDPFPVIRRVAA